MQHNKLKLHDLIQQNVYPMKEIIVHGQISSCELIQKNISAFYELIMGGLDIIKRAFSHTNTIYRCLGYHMFVSENLWTLPTTGQEISRVIANYKVSPNIYTKVLNKVCPKVYS